MQFNQIKLSFVLAPFTFVTLFICQSSMPSAAQTAKHSFTTAASPTWVNSEAVPAASAEQLSEARDGVVYLLSDHQVRVSGNTPAQSKVERYYRHVHQVIAQPGIEHVSQFELEFDPAYQRLVIHRIQIRRGPHTINALKPQEIRLLQKEDEMEQRLFNGTLAALVILDDVRVGDVVEYDYSLVGDNPILGGRFADVNYLVEAEPVGRLRYRLLWPAARPLQHQMRNLELQPKVQALGEATEYTWERANLAAPEADSEATLAVDEYPALYLTEFQSWQEVAAWAVPLYRVKGPLSPALRQQIESWRQASPVPEKQLLAAVRFVQDEIRYLGIELGPHSHLPHQPAQVLARRYGDCKDKALLLATALGALGIEAYPALVNTDLLGRVQELLPSPYAFDHVITQIHFNGQAYWFDPTVSLQRGGLAQHANPEFGRALVVRAESPALTEIPLPSTTKPLKTIREVYTVNPDNRTARLAITTTYRGVEADTMRDYLAKNTLKDLAGQRLQYRHARDRSFSADGKPEVEDDAESNTITITERYEVARFWRENARNFTAERVTDELPYLNPETKKPVQLVFPFDVEHQIEIRTPLPLAVTEASGKVHNDVLQFDYRRTRTGQTVKLSYRLRTLSAHVKAAQATQLADDLARIEDLSSFRLSNQVVAFDSLRGILIFGAALLLSLPLLAFVVYKAYQAKRQRSQPKARTPMALPGSEPANPFRVLNEAAAEERLLTLRCGCGGGYRLPPTGTARAGVIYDGKRLTLVALSCATCGQLRDVYIDYLPAATASYAASATEAPEQSG